MHSHRENESNVAQSRLIWLMASSCTRRLCESLTTNRKKIAPSPTLTAETVVNKLSSDARFLREQLSREDARDASRKRYNLMMASSVTVHHAESKHTISLAAAVVPTKDLRADTTLQVALGVSALSPNQLQSIVLVKEGASGPGRCFTRVGPRSCWLYVQVADSPGLTRSFG